MKAVKKILRITFTIAWCMVSVYVVGVVGMVEHFGIGQGMYWEVQKWSYQFGGVVNVIRGITGGGIVMIGLFSLSLPFLRLWNKNIELWRKAKRRESEKRAVGKVVKMENQS